MKEEIIAFIEENKTRIFVKNWLKKHKEEYFNELINWCNNYNISYTTISELIFIYVNSIEFKPLCKICNNEVSFISSTIGYRLFCSTKCQANDIDIINKRQNTTLDRYGVLNAFSNKEIQQKQKNTVREKYGVDNISQVDNIKKKKEETTFINYGVTHHSKLDHNKELYSVNIKNNKQKLTKGVIDKYGVENVSKVDYIQDKKDATFNKNSILRLKNRYPDYEPIIFNNYNDIVFKSKKCNHEFNIQEQLLVSRLSKNHIVCTICNPIIKNYSQLEKDIVDYIKQYNIEIQENVNTLIPDRKLELDIYLPEYKLGIEVNGVHWHCELYKDKNYHIDKKKLYNKEGITLIQIWEDDWYNKQDIIKAIIKTYIHKNNYKIYARKCVIKIVNKYDEQIFLNTYHLQGYVKSDICLGLYYNNELLSIMSFSKPRHGIGNISDDNSIELLRYCVKEDYNIVCGASKLLNNFIKNNNNNNKSIYSFCDLSYFTGDLYLKLGMKYINTTLDYYYIINGIKENRIKYMKHKLVEQGFDKNKTEHQIMFDNGYYKLYGAGIAKYELTGL